MPPQRRRKTMRSRKTQRHRRASRRTLHRRRTLNRRRSRHRRRVTYGGGSNFGIGNGGNGNGNGNGPDQIEFSFCVSLRGPDAQAELVHSREVAKKVEALYTNYHKNVGSNNFIEIRHNKDNIYVVRINNEDINKQLFEKNYLEHQKSIINPDFTKTDDVDDYEYPLEIDGVEYTVEGIDCYGNIKI